MKRKFLDNHSLRHAFPFAAACFTVGLTLFACADKDVETNDNDGKALVAFNVSETQDQAQAAAKAAQPMTRTAFANQLAQQDLTPEDLTMQKLPVQGAAASSDICLIETTVAGVPSQWEATTQTRADITTMPTMQNFSTTAFYGYSDTSLAPWFYDKDTNKDGNLVTPIYWDWFKNHACFYAVYPKPDNNKLKLSPASYAGTPYVDFEVEPNVKNQKDLMTACSGNVHLDAMGTAPRTDLTFRHALTAVRFKVGQNLSWNKTITKVEIVGAKSKGRYTLPTDKSGTGAAWSNLSDSKTFTLGGDGTVNVSTSEAINNVIMGNSGDNYVFYMIPQSLAGVSVKIYFADATPPIEVNLPGKWKPGTTKTYALSQNTSTWQYELTVTPPAAAEYSATSTGNYKIESYRKDPTTNTLQKVPWKVVGYSTDNGLTWSNNKPAWFTGLTKESGDGSTSGETGQATLQPEILIDKLAPRNAILKLNPKGSPSDYYDLSTHDIKGNSTPRNTANCYVISHPGYYKLPLVYGNAITGGNTNTSSYISSAPVTIYNGQDVILHNFKDHNNANITDPWIEKSNYGTNNGINGAKIVWADEANLVHLPVNPIVRSGGETFLQFEVNANDIKNGNVVIAVTKNNTVVWSWHLWFAPDDVLETTACTNYQGHVYNFTKETLGFKYSAWSSSTYSTPRSVKVKVRQEYGNVPKQETVFTIIQNPGSVKRFNATHYQFGRKDAMPGIDAVKEGNFVIVEGAQSIGVTIQTPNTFYYVDKVAPYDHYSSNYINTWSANYNKVSYLDNYNDDPVVKTIYDPCPAGFKMPASNAFTGFTSNGKFAPKDGSIINKVGPWDYGFTFNNKLTNPDATIYFPATGDRDYHGGKLIRVGIWGYYWTAVARPWSAACNFCFKNNYTVSPYGELGDRCRGLTVRPVADN